jgi:hypothetical protein
MKREPRKYDRIVHVNDALASEVPGSPSLNCQQHREDPGPNGRMTFSNDKTSYEDSLREDVIITG